MVNSYVPLHISQTNRRTTMANSYDKMIRSIETQIKSGKILTARQAEVYTAYRQKTEPDYVYGGRVKTQEDKKREAEAFINEMKCKNALSCKQLLKLSASHAEVGNQGWKYPGTLSLREFDSASDIQRAKACLADPTKWKPLAVKAYYDPHSLTTGSH